MRKRTGALVAAGTMLATPLLAHDIAYERLGWEDRFGSRSYHAMVKAKGSTTDTYVPAKDDYYYWLAGENNFGPLGISRRRLGIGTFPWAGGRRSIGGVSMDVQFTPYLGDAPDKRDEFTNVPLVVSACGLDVVGKGNTQECLVMGNTTVPRFKINLYKQSKEVGSEKYNLGVVRNNTVVTDTQKNLGIAKSVFGSSFITDPIGAIGRGIIGIIESADKADEANRSRTVRLPFTLKVSGLRPKSNLNADRDAAGLSGIRFFKAKNLSSRNDDEIEADTSLTTTRGGKSVVQSQAIYVRRSASLLLDRVPEKTLLAGNLLLTDVRASGDAFGPKFDAQYKITAPLDFGPREMPPTQPTPAPVPPAPGQRESLEKVYRDLYTLCTNLKTFAGNTGLSTVDGLLMRRSYLINAGCNHVINANAEDIAKAVNSRRPASSHITATKVREDCWADASEAFVQGVVTNMGLKLGEDFGKAGTR